MLFLFPCEDFLLFGLESAFYLFYIFSGRKCFRANATVKEHISHGTVVIYVFLFNADLAVYIFLLNVY